MSESQAACFTTPLYALEDLLLQKRNLKEQIDQLEKEIEKLKPEAIKQMEKDGELTNRGYSYKAIRGTIRCYRTRTIKVAPGGYRELAADEQARNFFRELSAEEKEDALSEKAFDLKGFKQFLSNLGHTRYAGMTIEEKDYTLALNLPKAEVSGEKTPEKVSPQLNPESG